MDIDVVIPHVDGAAPGYADACRAHTGGWVPCQVRDLGELRYVLRSIERHLPWVARPVLVVQDPGHLPAWLDRKAVRVVEHSSFIPGEHLPTFHWATISAHLHRIPGLAERFVIWEDDTLAGRPVEPADLFAPDGLPRTDPLLAPIWPGLERVIGGGYQQVLTWSRQVLRRHLRTRPGLSGACFLYPHQPVPVERTSFSRMFAELSGDPWFADTVTRRSRGEQASPTIDPIVVYANWVDLVERRRGAIGRYAACARQALASTVGRVLGLGRPRFRGYALVNDPAVVAARMRRMLRERPTFINVNDDAYDGYTDDAGVQWSQAERPNPVALARLHGALEALLPAPSRFERG